MNRKLVITLLFTLLICQIIFPYYFSSYVYGKNESFSPKRTLGITPPIFVIYNGTRYFMNPIAPIFLENKEPLFYLSMQLTFINYNDSITIIESTSNTKYVYKPLYSDEKNGTYNIENLPVNLNIRKGEYPYDYFIGNISFLDKKSEYMNLWTYGINKTYTSSDWKMVIYGDYNYLHFTVYRIKDVSVFEVLCIVGLVVLSLNIWFLILFLLACVTKEYKNKIRELFGSNLLFYFGLSIGLPFYFGVIFNNYLLTNPIPNSVYIYSIYFLAGTAAFIGALGFAIKERYKNL